VAGPEVSIHIIVITTVYYTQKWCKTITTDEMAIPSLAGPHLESESKVWGSKIKFFQSKGANMCAYFISVAAGAGKFVF